MFSLFQSYSQYVFGYLVIHSIHIWFTYLEAYQVSSQSNQSGLLLMKVWVDIVNSVGCEASVENRT